MRYLLLIPFFLGGRGFAAMTWEDCVHEAKKSNPELRAASETLRSAEFQLRGAYSGFFPSLSGALEYSHGDTATTGTQSTYGASLTAKQNLFSGFADTSAVRRASGLLEVAKANYTIAQARLTYDLKAAYAGSNYAERAFLLFTDILKRREANLKLVELRFQSGRENMGSLLLSRAYLEQARLDLLQATNAKETQKAALGRVLGMQFTDPPGLSGNPPVSDPPELTAIDPLVNELPDYKKAIAQERTAEAATTAAWAGFFPNLNLTATTANSDTKFFPANNRWSVGVALVVPLFSGGKDYYATKSTDADWKAAALAKENAFRQGRAQLFELLARYREAVQKWKVDKTFAEAVQTRAKIAREKYNNGLLTFEDWDVIENDLITRQRSLLQSERDRIVAEAAWLQLLGKGVF